MQEILDVNSLELQERVVDIRRVAKTVKGGRTMRFSALVVVGDENGHVGFGNGKAAEIPEAVRKAIEDAKKNLVTVPMVGTTIPHETIGKSGAGEVLLKPAGPGRSVRDRSPRNMIWESALRPYVTRCRILRRWAI